jgi:hypothetical protein
MYQLVYANQFLENCSPAGTGTHIGMQVIDWLLAIYSFGIYLEITLSTMRSAKK